MVNFASQVNGGLLIDGFTIHHLKLTIIHYKNSDSLL